MANTPNMNLALPTVSQTLGPAWATQLIAALGQIDSHNHTTGQGVAVPAAGINVNADLPFSGNNATSLRSARFTDQGAALTTPSDVGCLYLAGGNLFWNSGAGAAVQITSGGALAGTPGSIAGLGSPAAVTYTSGNGTFRFTSNTNTNAAVDVGPVTVRAQAAAANGITIQSPSGLAANYAVTLLGTLPAGQRALTIDNLGNLSTWNIDGSGLVSNAGVLTVVGAAAIAANTSATIKGNRSAADAGADVVSNGAVARTAGLIHDFQNNGASKAQIDYQGNVHGLNQWQTVYVASVTTSSTAFANIGVPIPVVANATYEFEVTFLWTSTGSSISGNVQWVGIPSGANFFWNWMTMSQTQTVSSAFLVTGSNAAVYPATLSTSGTTRVWGIIPTGASAGTVQAQFALGSGTGSWVLQNVILRYRRVDGGGFA